MFKPADLAVLALIAAVTLVWTAAAGRNVSGEPEMLRVVAESGEDTVSLNCDTLFRRGSVTIEIHGGKAGITDSDCPNRLCVRTGWLSETGQMSACMPNRVFIEVIGDQSETDIITY